MDAPSRCRPMECSGMAQLHGMIDTGVSPLVFAQFIVAALAIELTPGPNMGYLAIVTAQHGRRSGFLVVAGIAAGLGVYYGLSLVGVAEGLLANRIIYQSLRWAGVAYMIWLAIEAWFSRPDAATHPKAMVGAKLFGRGLITNLLNVKAAIIFVVVIPNFIDVTGHAVIRQAAVLGIVYLVIATVIHSIIVMVAGAGHVSRMSKRWRRIYAIGLMVIAIWLAWSTRALR